MAALGLCRFGSTGARPMSQYCASVLQRPVSDGFSACVCVGGRFSACLRERLLAERFSALPMDPRMYAHVHLLAGLYVRDQRACAGRH